MIRYTIVPTAWESFGFVARGRCLVATFLPRRTADIRGMIAQHWPDAVEDAEWLPRFCGQVADYFDGKRTVFTVDVDLSDMPPFQRAVLEACRGVPYGQTASYMDLARATGKPGAARAVGGAMGRNPLPLVIPCHRIVRADGSLGGFSSTNGVNEKERLLMLEDALPVAGALVGNMRPSRMLQLARS